MQASIRPGMISGIISAPPSKSMMQRVCAAALLHTGNTIIYNPGNSEDDLTALGIIHNLGATVIHAEENHIQVMSNGIEPVSLQIHCGESGLSARLFTPIAALSRSPILLEAKGSLLKRPMELFADILPQLDVSLSDFNGYLPFTVTGPLQARSLKIDGSASSQFLSGLLFALSYCATEAATIEVSNLKSKPYIDMTLQVLSHFGKPISHNHYNTFYIDPNLFQQKDNIEIDIEGDWSNAAYWLVAGAIRGSVAVKGLNLDSAQADKAILDLLKVVDAEMDITHDAITVKRGLLQPFEFDATDCPDLFPILAVLAAACDGESYIKGIHRLFHKESNRAESIAEMLQQFEIPFAMEDDTLCVTGIDKPEYATIDSYNDHRIVMAASIAALRAKGIVAITGAEAVNKSYPSFFKDLNSLGIDCGFKNE